MFQNKKALALLTVVLLAAFSLGYHAYAGDSIGYDQLRASAATRSFALQGSYPAAVDSSTWATPVNPVVTLGNPTVTVLCEAGTAAATATVKCGLYFLKADGTYQFLGEAPLISTTATATASSSGVTDGSLYPSNLVRFETAGACIYDVRVTAISSGTEKITQWVYGLKSK